MKRGRKPYIWTEDKIRYLSVNYARKTNAALAEEAGCSVGAIKLKAHELGLRKETLLDEGAGILASVQKMYMSDSYAGIARTLNVSLSSVRRCVKRLSAEGRILAGKDFHRSRVNDLIVEKRRALLKKERGHLYFGLPPVSSIRVTRSPKGRYGIRYQLRQSGYEVDYGTNDAYILPNTCRDEKIEKSAKSNGLNIWNIVAKEGDEWIYEKI